VQSEVFRKILTGSKEEEPIQRSVIFQSYIVGNLFVAFYKKCVRKCLLEKMHSNAIKCTAIFMSLRTIMGLAQDIVLNFTHETSNKKFLHIQRVLTPPKQSSKEE
jgi:hypothetical protein